LPPAAPPALAGSSPPLHGRLKARRQALKLSQDALARLLGISQGHLSKIERGLIDPATFSTDLRVAIDAWLATA
ncbi:MAG: helix-turn-helix transcriptional regulator, partial [Chloroflexota bacterium]|nr:helix-turn-helix transcriptional regulator [Chloroflexota bacterium]